jgi:hypothetical protein
MDTRGVVAGPGQYLIIGRKEDSDQEVYSVIDDLPPNADLRLLCSRALYEIGRNDPMSYDFSTMLYVMPEGGIRVVLNRTTLQRYVHVNYS